MLQLTALTKAFAERVVLDDVTSSIAAGETVALVGHNGSGKSTLIKILAGYYESKQTRTSGRNGL